MHKEYEDILNKILKQERKIRHCKKIEKLYTYQECLEVAKHKGRASSIVKEYLNNKYKELCESCNLADALKTSVCIFSPGVSLYQGQRAKEISTNILKNLLNDF